MRHDSMMTHRFSRPIAWLLLAFILFATIAPIGDRPHDYLPVQVDRALAFTLMTAFFVIAYPARWLLVGLICIASAYGIEATQYLQPSRDPHIADANVKAVGSVVGLLLGIIANVLRQRLRRLPS
jgi:VanZ family protein